MSFPPSRNLTHRREVNGFFAALAKALRTSRIASLREWWGERSASRGLPLAPDGIGRIFGETLDLRFLYEHDRSTENHGQLRAKVDRYVEAALLDHAPRVLLLTFLTEARKLQARSLLSIPGLTVATAIYADAVADPLGEVWRLLGEPIRRPIFKLTPPPGSDG